MPSDRIRKILPPGTAATWDVIAPLVPPSAYLGGGTAIAVHLGHRVSRDLDFFFHHGSIDLDELALRLSSAGPFAVTERVPGTLNGIFSATRVQFLHADEGRPQHLLEPLKEVDGLRVAQISDLTAMKLKVVDIDHTTLYDQGGPTCSCNLGGLSSHTHTHIQGSPRSRLRTCLSRFPADERQVAQIKAVMFPRE